MEIKKFMFLVLIIFLILFSGCAKTENGILKGRISIGPLCPVEKIPPDPKCQPTRETFNAFPIGIYDSNNQKISAISADEHGNFEIGLKPGTYFLVVEKQNYPKNEAPITVTIKPNETTIAEIEIDTGIR